MSWKCGPWRKLSDSAWGGVRSPSLDTLRAFLILKHLFKYLWDPSRLTVHKPSLTAFVCQWAWPWILTEEPDCVEILGKKDIYWVCQKLRELISLNLQNNPLASIISSPFKTEETAVLRWQSTNRSWVCGTGQCTLFPLQRPKSHRHVRWRALNFSLVFMIWFWHLSPLCLLSPLRVWEKGPWTSRLQAGFSSLISHQLLSGSHSLSATKPYLLCSPLYTQCPALMGSANPGQWTDEAQVPHLQTGRPATCSTCLGSHEDAWSERPQSRAGLTNQRRRWVINVST